MHPEANLHPGYFMWASFNPSHGQTPRSKLYPYVNRAQEQGLQSISGLVLRGNKPNHDDDLDMSQGLMA